ncbi:MAG: cyclic nucleotide-binding domain-containing protein [Bdellovibrionales bacterium]|nr:cyclic nucleotide-binding domain-containing protein [Bdellovibrionales bacterium]
MVNYLWDNIFKRGDLNDDIVQVLSENFIFKVLTKPELHFLRGLVHYRTYKPGEQIFSQGELGVGMYIVVQGTINITVEELHTVDEVQRNVFVTRLSRGDFFGEISLVEPAGRRTATATAAEEVALLGFFKPDLSEVIERNPRAAIKILSRLSEVLGRRLKETADRFAEVKRELRQMTRPDGNS